MKKKILSLILVASMVVCMAACGSAGGAGEKKADTPKAEAKAADTNGDGKVIVGYIQKNLTDPFQAKCIDAVQKGLDGMVKDGTIDEWTGVLDGNTDASRQVDLANDCISKGCDIVIMVPAEAEASDAALIAMNKAGIKVIEVNALTDSYKDLCFAYYVSDDVQGGEMLAQWVLDNCPSGGKYVHCTGVIGNSAQINRGKGINNLMSKHPEFKMVSEPDTQWQGNLAANAATDAIAQYGKELVAIICDNDDMSSAAQRACNDAGRKDIICVGIDGNENPLQMVKSGELKATILQDGVGQCQGALNAIKALCEGKGNTVKSDPIPFVLITSENVDNYLK
jgi:ABC-type sugar transport system substrate-binding protein